MYVLTHATMFHEVNMNCIELQCPSLVAFKVIMFNYFAVVISPASWREGQKLVKMVLGPVPKVPREEDRPQPADRLSRTGGTFYTCRYTPILYYYVSPFHDTNSWPRLVSLRLTYCH